MIQFPNCKINLGLNVVKRRTDGYHTIETVLYPVPFSDVLEIIPAPDGVFKFHTSGLTIQGEPGQNLCVKAYKLLKLDYRLPAVKMHLHKIIPTGSGLGGGSSDGAFTLKMLNELFKLRLETGQLENYARQLGSDCAFFIENQAMFAHGKGDHFDQVSLNLAGLHLVLVVPGLHVVTADAYRMVVPGRPDVSLKELIRHPVEDWKDKVKNDFEKPVMSTFPVIADIKEKFYDEGAIYASMSGSGCAVYGIFQQLPDLEKFRRHFIWSTRL